VLENKKNVDRAPSPADIDGLSADDRSERREALLSVEKQFSWLLAGGGFVNLQLPCRDSCVRLPDKN